MTRAHSARSDRRRTARLLPVGAAGVAVLLALAATAGACTRGSASPGPGQRVIVLGFDGMDHALTSRLMDEGRLPHLSRLASEGSFSPLGTSIPPQSPVAWSNFITGMDAGGHGIFDFIHRDPSTMIPYLSTSRTEGSERNFKIGKWQIPISGASVELLRHGKSFWEELEEHGIETTIVRMPANFPPSGGATREISGMGTPDLVGSYGTFSYYTSDPLAFAGKKVTGGKVYVVNVRDNTVKASLHGPDNPFRVEKEKVSAEFTVHIDPVEDAARLVVGDREMILKVGEWSDWATVTFELFPTQSLQAIGRFYLKAVRPDLGLYVTPLNLDPTNSAMPISTPSSFAADLAEKTGLFYTQGMPEDTKALSEGVFTPEEFLSQARLAGEDVIRQYGPVLDGFTRGLLFYYVGNVDQISHMMWRSMDPEHPAYDEELDAPFADVIPKLYEELDGMVGLTLERMREGDLLVVMSDHGFTSWRRAFHVNTWLKEHGYLSLIDPDKKDDPGLFLNVDWSGTRAYALGLNGLYINLRGRERYGIVSEGQRRGLMDEIAEKLLETVDPATGQRAVTKVYKREDAFRDRGHLGIGPDIVIGTAKGVRGSNESALGEVPPEMFTDNIETWSGDHCMDHDAVPGVLFTNRPLKKPATKLEELAPSVLAEFGIEGFPARNGSKEAH